MAKYAGVSLALGKKRQHFGDSQLSPLLFQGELVGEGMHRKEAGKMRTAAAVSSDAAKLNAEEEDSNASSNPTQGHSLKGSERSRVISVAHPIPLHKGSTARLEKMWIFPTQPSKFVHFPSTNKTLPGSQFLNSLCSLSL